MHKAIIAWGVRMQKSQAIAVMREIVNAWQDNVLINYVSLDGQSDNYEIRVGCCLDGNSQNLVKPILERYGLGLKIGDGFVIFYSISAKPRANYVEA